MGPRVCAQHLGRPRGSSRHPCVCEGGITNSFHIRGNQGSEREGDVPKVVQLVGAKLRSQTKSDSDCPRPHFVFKCETEELGLQPQDTSVLMSVMTVPPFGSPALYFLRDGLDLAPSWPHAL